MSGNVYQQRDIENIVHFSPDGNTAILTTLKNNSNSKRGKWYEKCRLLGALILFLTNIILMASLFFILHWHKHSCKEPNDDTDFNYNDIKEALKRTKSIVESSNIVPRSCSQYKRREKFNSGNFLIDPEQQIGINSKFSVYCNFETDETLVFHDKFNQTIDIKECDKYLCYHQNLVYETSISKISKLVDSSKECYQEIRFSCYSSKFTKHAAWKDRNGEIQIYFTSDQTNVCKSCGNSNQNNDSCLENYNCDCDTEDNVKQRKDVVRINTKNLLPITSFMYGLMYSNHQKASVNIGPLVCKEQEKSIKSFGSTCDSWKTSGMPSGYYLVEHRPHGESINNLAVSFCNMSNPKASAVLKWIHPTYEMIFDIQHKNIVQSQKESSQLYFDNITVTNPNGTVSIYKNQYQFLVQSGSFQIVRKNFGQHSKIIIEIRRMSRRGWYDWAIRNDDEGEHNSFTISKDYFFNFRIKNISSNNLTLNCTRSFPCTIIVRQKSELRIN